MTHIFVFGSNLAGIHGAGAAKFAAQKFRAKYGEGIGHWGNSYAVPTKDANIETLPLSEIARYVKTFILYAKEHPELTFQLTAVGCGLAGYTAEQIRPMFLDTPPNVTWPPEFLEKNVRELVWNLVLGYHFMNSFDIGRIRPESINPTIRFLIDRGYFELIGDHLSIKPVAVTALEFYRGF